jgi:hypothetical protein
MEPGKRLQAYRPGVWYNSNQSPGINAACPVGLEISENMRIPAVPKCIVVGLWLFPTESNFIRTDHTTEQETMKVSRMEP